MPIQTREELTVREREQMEYDREMWAKQSEHAIEIKKLEIEALKLDAKISSWLKLPISILKLPVYMLLGLGYIIHAIKGTEPSDNFWKLLK